MPSIGNALPVNKLRRNLACSTHEVPVLLSPRVGKERARFRRCAREERRGCLFNFDAGRPFGRIEARLNVGNTQSLDTTCDVKPGFGAGCQCSRVRDSTDSWMGWHGLPVVISRALCWFVFGRKHGACWVPSAFVWGAELLYLHLRRSYPDTHARCCVSSPILDCSGRCHTADNYFSPVLAVMCDLVRHFGDRQR